MGNYLTGLYWQGKLKYKSYSPIVVCMADSTVCSVARHRCVTVAWDPPPKRCTMAHFTAFEHTTLLFLLSVSDILSMWCILTLFDTIFWPAEKVLKAMKLNGAFCGFFTMPSRSYDSVSGRMHIQKYFNMYAFITQNRSLHYWIKP